MGMIGYSQYCPTKFALRGLAECLRQELLPHGIKTHIYFVSTIKTPGYEQENLTKPEITRKIEDGDISDQSPSARAKVLLKGTLIRILCKAFISLFSKGIVNENFYITSDVLTDVFRVTGSCTAPWNSVIDILLLMIGLVQKQCNSTARFNYFRSSYRFGGCTVTGWSKMRTE